ADLCRLIEMQISDGERHAGKTYNVGGGPDMSISLLELTRYCQALTGATIRIDPVAETPAADIPYYGTDNPLLTTESGWRPERSLATTLAEIHEWLLDNRTTVAPILAGGH